MLSGADLSNKSSTRTALEEMGISLTDVVVLSQGEYEEYTPAKGQVVFVLPDAIGKPSMETARIAMASTVAGI